MAEDAQRAYPLVVARRRARLCKGAEAPCGLRPPAIEREGGGEVATIDAHAEQHLGTDVARLGAREHLVRVRVRVRVRIRVRVRVRIRVRDRVSVSVRVRFRVRVRVGAREHLEPDERKEAGA